MSATPPRPSQNAVGRSAGQARSAADDVRERPTTLLVMSPGTYAEQFGPEQVTRLRDLAQVGDPVVIHELDSEDARARLAEAQVLITSWGAPALTGELLDAAPRLRAVIHCAGSVRQMLDDDALARGIAVSTAADMNAIPVAEYTLAAIIMAGKRVPFHAGRAAPYRRAELSNRGRQIGIVGFSRIGRRVLDLLKVLEHGEILVSDPYADAETVARAGARLAELPEVLAHAEILSVHAPSLPETRGLIGADQLALLRDGATLINTARGALVDHEALTAECARGRLYAFLDVTDPEPLPPDHPLRSLDTVVLSPHVAGSLGNETQRMSDHGLDDLQRWIKGEPLLGAVLPGSARVMA